MIANLSSLFTIIVFFTSPYGQASGVNDSTTFPSTLYLNHTRLEEDME